MNKRTKGKEGEILVRQYYEQQGFRLIEANFTIRGGEIDLLMQKENLLVVIEVKYVDTIQELDNYISPKKI
jgi:putative endonuclease